jgi:hypothetical protein
MYPFTCSICVVFIRIHVACAQTKVLRSSLHHVPDLSGLHCFYHSALKQQVARVWRGAGTAEWQVFVLTTTNILIPHRQ